MNKLLGFGLAVGLAGLIGCGPGAAPRDQTMVDVTATVTGPDGKPLSKAVVVVLQPTGDTLAAKLVATEDGKFTGKAMPGKYVFYVQMAKGEDVPPKGMPAKYTDPRDENAVTVAAGTPLDIKLSN